MIDIVEYMKRSRDDRTSHINLLSSCIERGGNSTKFQGILTEKLDTSFPEVKKRGENGIFVHLCHACHNGKCSNYHHIYWGTPAENLQDNNKNGKFINVWEATVTKHGIDKALSMARDHQRTVASLGGIASAKKTRKPR